MPLIIFIPLALALLVLVAIALDANPFLALIPLLPLTLMCLIEAGVIQ